MKKIGIGLIICLVGFPQISETIYTPALPAIAADLAANVHFVEATLAIYFVGFALGVFLWGSISDFAGRRNTMLIGLFIFLASCLACSFAPNVESLLFWRLVQAFGASVGSVITQTMLRDIYEGKERSRIFSVLCGALAFSPALGPLAGGYLSEFFGWRFNFLTLVIIGCILFVWSFFSLPETKPSKLQRPSVSQMLTLFKEMSLSKRLWGHTLLIGATNGILFSFYEEAPFVFIKQLGMRPSLYGLLGIIIAGAAIAASKVSYSLSDRYPPEKIIQLGSMTSFLGGICLILLQGFGLFTLSHIGMALSLSSLFMVFIGIGLIIPNSLSSALKDYQVFVGTAGSFFGAGYYFLIALATWGMSLIHNGTTWPLPLYITFLSTFLIYGSRMTATKKMAAVLR